MSGFVTGVEAVDSERAGGARAGRSDHAAIGDYAVVGDTRTAALCSLQGSIDWLCLPRFDSEPVFGSLVGGERSGRFSIFPIDCRGASRSYRAGSSVLETSWETSSGAALLTDAMIVDLSGSLLPQAVLVRRVRCTGGAVSIGVIFDPKRGLPGRPPRWRRDGSFLMCSWGSSALALGSDASLLVEPGREAVVQLTAGEEATFTLSFADRAPLVLLSSEAANLHVESTASWWQTWSGELRYDGPFREAVERSLITLRLLTYSPSGAPLAAPTTSLPEVIGGDRNWDYRLSWPRDASIGVAAFLSSGMREEAASFMHWLTHACRLTHPRLDVLYTLYGKPGPEERVVQGVPGYRGSLPVRVGNAAQEQHQLDVYGWVVDAAWLLTQSGERLGRQTWRSVRGFADFAARSWRLPDAGIWEVRGDPAHYVHSKLMAWLSLDRAVRMAEFHPAAVSRVARWRREKQMLADEVSANGFDDDKNAYVWRYGSTELDAALLLLPLLEFEQSTARVKGTVAAIQRELGAGNGLLYRYRRRADRLLGDEGAFLPCSFWLVQALARTGDLDAAQLLFEHLLGFANDVGLLSEEVDPQTGELLGNFPQALTHATLVQAAIAMEKASAKVSPPADLSEAS